MITAKAIKPIVKPIISPCWSVAVNADAPIIFVVVVADINFNFFFFNVLIIIKIKLNKIIFIHNLKKKKEKLIFEIILFMQIE